MYYISTYYLPGPNRLYQIPMIPIYDANKIYNIMYRHINCNNNYELITQYAIGIIENHNSMCN